MHQLILLDGLVQGLPEFGDIEVLDALRLWWDSCAAAWQARSRDECLQWMRDRHAVEGRLFARAEEWVHAGEHGGMGNDVL